MNLGMSIGLGSGRQGGASVLTPSFVATNYAGNTSVTLPAHQTGDLVLAFAFNTSGTPQPTLGTGSSTYTDFGVGSDSGNTPSFRGGYLIAASNAETCTGWTSASRLVVAVLRKASGTWNVGTAGYFKASLPSTATTTWGALTLGATAAIVAAEQFLSTDTGAFRSDITSGLVASPGSTQCQLGYAIGQASWGSTTSAKTGVTGRHIAVQVPVWLT